MNKKVKLIECVRTWQAEGIDSGKAALLCRFKYCNKKCKFCDTIVKMRISKESEYSLNELQEEIEDNRLGIVITGGEPTIDRHFNDTLTLLNELNYGFANVESNGYKLELLNWYLKDSTKNIRLIYSPKIFSKIDLEEEIERTNELFPLKRVYIKIVYEDTTLIHSYLEFLSETMMKVRGVENKHSKVFLMPEGTTRATLIQNSEKVFDAAEKYNFNFSSRDHIIYGFV